MLKNWLLRASSAFLLAAVVTGAAAQSATAAGTAVQAAAVAGPTDGLPPVIELPIIELPVVRLPDDEHPWG